MDQAFHTSLDGGKVSVGLPIRVDFKRPKRRSQGCFPVANWTSEKICQGVCRVCGYEETSCPAFCGNEGDGARCSGLADPAFTPDEK